jgi:hypothetical protein
MVQQQQNQPAMKPLNLVIASQYVQVAADARKIIFSAPCTVLLMRMMVETYQHLQPGWTLRC